LCGQEKQLEQASSVQIMTKIVKTGMEQIATVHGQAIVFVANAIN
jgi:hypothetical protein